MGKINNELIYVILRGSETILNIYSIEGMKHKISILLKYPISNCSIGCDMKIIVISTSDRRKSIIYYYDDLTHFGTIKSISYDNQDVIATHLAPKCNILYVITLEDIKIIESVFTRRVKNHLKFLQDILIVIVCLTMRFSI